MMLRLTASDFHRLPAEVQAAGLEWMDAPAEGRWVLLVDVLEEGRARLRALTRAGEYPASGADDLYYDRHGLTVLTRAFYTSTPPPPELVAAMRVVA